MAGWRVGERTGLWVGRSLDLYCEVCRGAEDAGLDLDLDDLLVMFVCCLFSWGRGWRL